MSNVIRWAVLTMGVAGCAGVGPASRAADPPKSPFPTQAELAAVTQRPAPQLGKDAPYVDVAEWPLAGPFPDGAAREPVSGEEPWTAALLQSVTGRAGVTLTTRGMQCTARELGRFLLQYDNLPSPALRQFIAARCGAAVVGLSARWVVGTADPEMPDAELFGAWKAQLDPLYAELPPGNADVAVVLVRKETKAVVMRVTGQRRALLESVAGDAAAPGVFVLRAEMLNPAASVRVMINRGRFGFAPCEVTYQAPRVEARCPSDISDAHAWISLAAFPAGRVLGEQVLDALVWPSGSPADRYTRVAAGTSAKATSKEALQQGVLAAINGLRQTAGLAALTEEPSQSATAGEVAPYYFAAQQHQLPETVADVVALGMRAGWQVTGLIQQGQFAAPATLGTDDVGDLIGLAIEHPFGRETLLDPSARKIAIGAVWAESPRFIGAVITTYALLEDPTPSLSDSVWQRLDDVRKAAGRAPFERSEHLTERTERAAESLLAGEVDADATLRSLMTAYPGGASGFWVEMRDPMTLEVPAALLRAEQASVAVVVARHRRAGQPWGSYIVFMVAQGRIAEMNI